MLKILLICPWLPWPPFDGARIRIHETLKHLSKKHEVTLFANVQHPDEQESIDALAGLCERIEVAYLESNKLSQFSRMAKGLLAGSSFIQSFHYNRRLAHQIRTITSATDFDIVQIELSFLARYAGAISPTSRAQKVLSTHNIETQRFQRELRLSSWDARHAVLQADSLFFPRWEARAAQQFDGALAVSESDRLWIRERAPHCSVELVPNGVDVDFFHPNRAPNKAEPRIVFTGIMDYPPNVDAVCWFVDEIFPAMRKAYPDLRFQVVGAKPSDRVQALGNHQGVDVTGRVPDVRPYVDGATAFVVPLRSGGGTRLKILQAMSMECPVVSTAVGAEGLRVENDRNILFAEDAPQFIAEVGKLLESDSEASRIGSEGRELAMREYAWSRCLLGIDALYERLLTEA
jgi:sugar transferase (PEP-CTERM/EpsH1 system associated)